MENEVQLELEIDGGRRLLTLRLTVAWEWRPARRGDLCLAHPTRDLKLLRLTPMGAGEAFAHTVLACERRGELFNAIGALTQPQPVPAYCATYLCLDAAYTDTHYGNTQQTPYGDPLYWVPVEALLAFRTHPGVQDNPINRATWAYLACLDTGTQIALYWH